MRDEEIEALTEVPDVSDSIGAAVEAAIAKNEAQPAMEAPAPDAVRPGAASVEVAQSLPDGVRVDAPPAPPTEPWALISHELRENQTRVPRQDPIAERMKEAGWEAPPTPPPEAGSTWEGLQAALSAPKAPQTAAQAPIAAPGRSEPDWGALQEQIQAAERSADLDRSIDAMLHAAAPGFVPPPNIGQGAVAAARLPLEIEKHRREVENADRARSAKLLEDTRAAALNDPSSPESKRAQEAYLARFEGDPRLAPSGVKQMSANEIEKLTGGSVALSGQKVAADKAAAEQKRKDDEATTKKTKAEGDAAAETTSMADEVAALLVDPRAKKLGLTKDMLDGLNRKGLDGVRRQMESIHQDKPVTVKPTAHIKAGDIDSVPERRAGYRALVQGIAEGRIEAPKAASKFGAELASDVLAYQPDFDATKFGAYKKVRDQQATGKDVVAIDVGLEHLATARRLIPKNADTAYVNRVKQAIASGTGDAEFKPYIAASLVAAHELAKIYGIEDQAGKAMVEHQLEAVQSPEQLGAVFDTFIELVEGKQKGLAKQLERVAPRGGKPPIEKSTATVRLRTKDGKKKKMVSRETADEILSAPGGDAYEEYQEE